MVTRNAGAFHLALHRGALFSPIKMDQPEATEREKEIEEKPCLKNRASNYFHFSLDKESRRGTSTWGRRDLRQLFY